MSHDPADGRPCPVEHCDGVLWDSNDILCDEHWEMVDETNQWWLRESWDSYRKIDPIRMSYEEQSSIILDFRAAVGAAVLDIAEGRKNDAAGHTPE
jgi:hypothetical protein